ncbi:MAG: hypothetical protein Q8P03_01795 [bacterium]|nr:hypothetical protein [bacterium]
MSILYKKMYKRMLLLEREVFMLRQANRRAKEDFFYLEKVLDHFVYAATSKQLKELVPGYTPRFEEES